jgi:Cu(I)/Ag(I) efflux system membrane protein CusA/SilA
MLSAAILSITFAPAMRDLLIRGKIHSEAKHPISRAIIRVYKPFVFVALRRPKSTIAIGLLAILSAVPLGMKLGHEFMPPLDEGDLLYMPTTFPNVSIEEAKRVLQYQDRILKSFPEVETVYGKAGRAETPTDPAPLTMVETTVRLKPHDEWRKVPQERWYSSWAPEPLQRMLRPIFPDSRTKTWDELTAEMNKAMQFPGWTNAYTQPIKTRVDMLSTGVRTPIGVKVLGTDLDEIEKVGVTLERLLAPIKSTRSVFYERNTGGLYLDIVPNRDALARYGLTVGDVQRTIEAAIGGAPISTTIEGRNRFSINVRYPQDLRSDLDRLRRVLVPVGQGGAASGGMGFDTTSGVPRVLFAQMGGMEGGAPSSSSGPARPSTGGTATDAPSLQLPSMPGGGGAPAPGPMGGSGGSGAAGAAGKSATTFVPLGQLADIRVAGGPPMVRDEGGLLVGYVYVDMDQGQRDIGGYVDEAKQVVAKAVAAGELKMPQGYLLEWTGQYELLEQMAARMKIVLPLTFLLIVVLLWWHFKNVTEVLIVLLSIPFALVGSVWLMYALDYRLSTAVWVGIIALVGLAAQTGIVMIVYIDNAYERRRKAGKIRDLNDIIWAHMEGTVMRVRPKLMTVGTMLVGLVPLLWAQGSGADVMKRIAAPMVGGLLTSAFLTLEIIPVVYTYWRQEQILWERLAELDPARLLRLQILAAVQKVGWALLAATGVLRFYVALPHWVTLLALAVAVVAIAGGFVAYIASRPAAKRQVWPEQRMAA